MYEYYVNIACPNVLKSAHNPAPHVFFGLVDLKTHDEDIAVARYEQIAEKFPRVHGWLVTLERRTSPVGEEIRTNNTGWRG